MRETLVKKNRKKGERKMEKLVHDVVENSLEAVSEQTCPIKKALPVALPFVAVVGLVLLGVKVLKKRKAKKVASQETLDVNPEEV